MNDGTVKCHNKLYKILHMGSNPGSPAIVSDRKQQHSVVSYLKVAKRRLFLDHRRYCAQVTYIDATANTIFRRFTEVLNIDSNSMLIYASAAAYRHYGAS